MRPPALFRMTLLCAAATLGATAVAAAPAERAPPAACAAAAPAEGASFSGPVLQVTEGGALCVALGPTPDQWVPVRPAGLIKAAARTPRIERAVMMSAAFAKRVDCVAGASVDGVVEAVCTIDGARLSEAVKTASDNSDWQVWR